MTQGSWWPFGAPRESARVRLVCLPYAGGGASVYRAWSRASDPDIEVCPLQLPGREGRIREAPYRRVEPLVEALLPVLEPVLSRPWAIFGYSMGALIGFEIAKRLVAEERPAPLALIAAAARPPHRMRTAHPLHALADGDFTAALRDLKGTPEAVLSHAELMELLLPTLRADFELCETYVCRYKEPIACPITAIGGTRDPNVPLEDLHAWGDLTTAGFRAFPLEAEHFFLESHASEIRLRVGEALSAGAANRVATRPGEPGGRSA